jgi:hypothetical protein
MAETIEIAGVTYSCVTDEHGLIRISSNGTELGTAAAIAGLWQVTADAARYDEITRVADAVMRRKLRKE